LLKVIHALLGVLFIAGLVGRWITLGAAARASVMRDVRTLLDLSSRFERIVIVTSSLVLVFGVATAIAQGRPFLGPIQGAPVDWLFVSLVLYLSAIPLVPLVFLPRGRLFGAELDAATEKDEVTFGLRTAFADPVVRAAHIYELVVVGTVLVLMIWKPF
jgi:hypothetical protein